MPSAQLRGILAIQIDQLESFCKVQPCDTELKKKIDERLRASRTALWP